MSIHRCATFTHLPSEELSIKAVLFYRWSAHRCWNAESRLVIYEVIWELSFISWVNFK